MIRNQSGSVLVALVFTLPVILTVAIAAVVISQILVAKSQSEELCRKEIVRSQKLVKKGSVELMKLNRKATLARSRVAAARARLAAALASGLPPAIATAKLQLHKARIYQEVIHNSQIAILYAYNASLKLQQINLTQQLQQRASTASLAEQRIELRKIPPQSRSPNYIPYSDHKKRHCFNATWTLNLQPVVVQWALQFLKLENSLKLSCGASQEFQIKEKDFHLFFAKDKCL
ncbi:MAG: hypothetical protein COT74_07265 [Bdellovibrionales bacterium CG10_big_fil_rev_8_21_14_0_10_45_34]|nr:MAG: hypothetical protein COT74_07265 [Bdellovibrionales bacterium CG10_big_fil_rev_8_21_14_0_10_45_34]